MPIERPEKVENIQIGWHYFLLKLQLLCNKNAAIKLPVFVILLNYLTFNAPITTKVVCFSPLLKCLRSLHGKQCRPRSDCSMANSVDPDQTAPIGEVCSGSTLFASLLNSSAMLGSYLQQTTSADDIFRCIFFLAFRVKMHVKVQF